MDKKKLKAIRRRKAREKAQNIARQLAAKEKRENKEAYRNKKGINYINASAPEFFSVVENPESVIGYFNHAKRIIRGGNSVCFDMENVTRLTPDAIAFFIAHFKDRTYSNNYILEAKPPSNPQIEEKFNQSGIHKHVSSKLAPPPTTGLLHRATDLKVNNVLAKTCGERVSMHCFGKIVRLKALFAILIELMANTNNHASVNNEKSYFWWLFVDISTDDKIASITFVDLGVGIFESLHVKRAKSLLSKVIKISPNEAIWNKLANGEIGSRTGLGERGKGIPLICEHAKNDYIRSMKLITNDVYIDLKADTITTMAESFSGTLYHIEISDPTHGN